MNTSSRQPSPNPVARRLIDWFAVHARDLPWRRTLDPYAIWVSEIMLQQTQVKTVVSYFERWMKAAPDIATLAKLTPTQLHKLWEGLGYYTRARNLQKAAIQILQRHDGRFPIHYDRILELSGIGRYTAGAISSIAFNQPQPIVDGNVIRVLSRLHGIEGDPKDKEVNERFWDASLKLVQAAGRMRAKTPPSNRRLRFSGNCSMLNQSLMELGATICTPKNPDCDHCPVKRSCIAKKMNRISDLPQLANRVKSTPRKFIAFIVSHRNRYYARQRPPGVVNAHLWELPNVEIAVDAKQPVEAALAELGLNDVHVVHVTTLKHSITRYRILTECHQVTGDQILVGPGMKLMSQAQLRKLPFTSAHRRLIEHI